MHITTLVGLTKVAGERLATPPELWRWASTGHIEINADQRST
jgi:hypothetical protein